MNEILIYRSSMIFQLAFLLLFLPLTKQKWKVIMGTATAFILTGIVEYMNFDPAVYMNRQLNVLLLIIIVLAAALFLCRYSDWRAVFTVLCSSNYVMIGNVVAEVVLVFRGGMARALTCQILIHATLLYLLVRTVRKNYLMELEMADRKWSRICLIPVLFYMTVYGMTVWPVSIAEVPNICGALICVFLLMGFYYVSLIIGIAQSRNEAEKINASALMEKYTEGILHEARTVRNHQKLLAIQRHDLRHQYALIKSLLDEGQYDEIYLLEKSGQQLESLKEIRYCENSIVNGIIGIYHAKAERAQIDFTYKIDVPAEFEQAKDFGFATMLSNLLENAFIAVCKVPDSQERKVSVRIEPKKEQLIIEIRNNYFGKLDISRETGLPVTDKADGHGYGLVSVSNYARKSGALLKFRPEGQLLVVQYITNL